MISALIRLLREDAGQDLIEYALLAGFISIVAVVAISNIGRSVGESYEFIDSKVKTIPTGS